MVPFSLDKQTVSYNSPHDCLMSLAMDLYGNSGCQMAVFNVDALFAHHFMASHHPPPSTLHPYDVLEYCLSQ